MAAVLGTAVHVTKAAPAAVATAARLGPAPRPFGCSTCKPPTCSLHLWPQPQEPARCPPLSKQHPQLGSPQALLLYGNKLPMQLQPPPCPRHSKPSSRLPTHLAQLDREKGGATLPAALLAAAAAEAAGKPPLSTIITTAARKVRKPSRAHARANPCFNSSSNSSSSSRRCRCAAHQASHSLRCVWTRGTVMCLSSAPPIPSLTPPLHATPAATWAAPGCPLRAASGGAARPTTIATAAHPAMLLIMPRPPATAPK
mmetsp:Transcript_6861/g.16458  ORF Transcript_6861/g.16458 Transcript_6861/m.16458 type:complete len:256 (-) Transcript_6861:670-1437(-)